MLEIASNLDNTWDLDVADVIRQNGKRACYPAWDFWGEVWWDDGKWHCEVWVYRTARETITSDTIPELMRRVSDKYGYD